MIHKLKIHWRYERRCHTVCNQSSHARIRHEQTMHRALMVLSTPEALLVKVLQAQLQGKVGSTHCWAYSRREQQKR